MIRGSFDEVTATEAMGWAFAPGRAEPVLVQAVLNQEILGEALADRHRPDLADAGFGNGNAGFAIKFFRPIDAQYLPFISVKLNGGDAELPRAPMMGFKDFFTSLNHAKPYSGRHRSLIGGLWTDRTDAAALLQGKLRVSTLSPEAAPSLEKLVHYGYMTIENDHPPLNTWQQELHPTSEAFASEPTMRPLLNAILEDEPLVAATQWFTDDEPDFGQASARTPSPSPGECLEVIIAFNEGVSLDVVRNSHAMPEFTTTGKSRWLVLAASNGSQAETMGLLDNSPLSPGKMAIMSPGCIYRLRCDSGAMALRLVLVPLRGRTAKIL